MHEGHTTRQIIDEYDAARLEALWPHPERIAVAMRLALDIEACEALMLGRPVDPSRLDPDELRRALEPGLVQLVRPIDVLHGRTA
jgi:hypothetical protein